MSADASRESRSAGGMGPLRGGDRGVRLGPPGLIGTGAKAKRFLPSFKRLAGRLRPDRTLLIVVMLMAVVGVACQVAGPKILARATNTIYAGAISRQAIDFGEVGRTLATVTAVYLIGALFIWIQAYMMAGIVQRTVYRLRREVDLKLARLPLKFFDGHARGDVLSRLTNDIDNIQQTMQQVLTQMITAFLTLIGVMAMMFLISWSLTLISVVVVPVSLVLTMLIAKHSQRQFSKQWKRTGELNGRVEEMFTGHNVVKLFGRQKEAIQGFDDQNAGLFRASFKAQFISGIIMPIMMFVTNLNYVAVCVLGGLRVASGTMSLGDVQAFIQYVQRFGQPIAQTAGVANVLQSAVASAERVFETLDEAEESPEPALPRELKQVSGHLKLEAVSFRYLPDVPLIEGLNLEVEPGQTVAIVGPTGAGKTTLVNLLMRFYEIDKGTISIDGVDIRKMTRDGLRRLFGMVLQDAWMFSGTIRDNIAYGREGAKKHEIIAAAEAAHVDHFVRTLPDGYETVVDDESTNLSQGERQLVTIARAFLADPQILILDEATSSVDTRTEVLIQKAMARLLKGRTSFVIAHRLSTIRDADVILVMNEGAIVEQGNHHELMCRRGFYWDLYNSQFSEAVDEAC